MMKRRLLLMLALLSLLVLTSQVLGQETNGPSATVQVVLDRQEAATGELINADVMVIGGENIAGADIEINVGECLRIEQLQAGTYLPTDGDQGGFVPLSNYGERFARLAANIIDRRRVATGDGVFMRVPMRAVCSAESETVTVTRAELVNDLGQQFSAETVSGSVTIVGDGSSLIVADNTPDEAIPPASPLVWILIGLVLALLVTLMLAWRMLRPTQSRNS